MPRAEQREAGELRGERQAQDDQRRAVAGAGEHQSGAVAGPGAAGRAAGAGRLAAPGEGDVSAPAASRLYANKVVLTC